MPWRAISYAPKALDCRTQAQYMCLLVQCVTLRPELGTRNEGGRQTPRTQGQGRLNHLSEACPTSSRSTYLGRPGCSRQSSPGQTSQSRFDQARLTHGVDSTEQWLLCLATASSTRSLPPPLLSASIYRPRRAGSKLRKRLSMPTNGGWGMCKWRATLAMRHCTVYLRRRKFEQRALISGSGVDR